MGCIWWISLQASPSLLDFLWLIENEFYKQKSEQVNPADGKKRRR
jgi:hypothetical protein